MNIELVIWHDHRSGITHVCKRDYSEGYSEHLTPISASDEEKALIKEMCRQTAVTYGAPDTTNIRGELKQFLTDFESYKKVAANDFEVTAYSKAIIAIEGILENNKI